MMLVKSGSIDEMLKDEIGETLLARMRSEEKRSPEEKALGEKIFGAVLSEVRPVRVKRFPAFLQYAATLTILLTAGIFLYFQTSKRTAQTQSLVAVAQPVVTVRNDGSESKRIALEDGSIVVLEPGSEVSYHKEFKNSRELFLSGEAFFEVTKDPAHPFLVYANEVTTRVLGTSFLIKANKQEKEIVVAVKTGKVSVFAKSNDNKFQHSSTKEITLTPNQQAIYKRQEHVVVKKVVEVPEVIVEQKAIKSNYVNEEVVVILKALSESYGVDIRYDEKVLEGCTLTSDIIESEGLYDQLDIVCGALGGTYILENDASIVIEANGCK
jgi:hypothetical protein